MGVYQRRRCPVCDTAALQHCPSPYCPWWRCPREACRAVISFRRRVGLQRLPGGVVRNFVFPIQPGG